MPKKCLVSLRRPICSRQQDFCVPIKSLGDDVMPSLGFRRARGWKENILRRLQFRCVWLSVQPLVVAMVSEDLDLVVSKAAKDAIDALGYVIKREQLEVVVQFVLGHDVFAVVLAGYGKSLSYQCLPNFF